MCVCVCEWVGGCVCVRTICIPKMIGEGVRRSPLLSCHVLCACMYVCLRVCALVNVRKPTFCLLVRYFWERQEKATEKPKICISCLFVRDSTAIFQ